MSDDSPRPLPTWEEFASAQTGRWFFVRWMLAALVPAGYLAADSMVFTLYPLTPNFIGDALGLGWFAVWGVSQGWVLFRGRWRTWAWTATWGVACFVDLRSSRTHLVLLLLGTLQLLLLDRIRRRPAWWLLASQTSLALCIWTMNARWNWLYSLRSRLALIYPPPAWMDPEISISSAAVLLYSAITGAALAWLMPPVAPAAADSRVMNEA